MRRFPLRRERIGVQLATDHPLAAEAEIEIDAAATYPVRMHDRDANPAVHDQLTALLRAAGREPRFHTPALSFDIVQRDLRDRATVSLAGAAALSTPVAGLTRRPLRGTPALTIYLVLPREQSPLHRRIRSAAKDLAHELGWLR
ncbi:LysR substrate-binding domain-containing protein [Nocardia sp. CA-151230]|uniref:LysR substrate-binding domain-containing protein n=1 Tax=Nocardia sp. CA-151230 TaxID=3239982 RepID=UPI003D8CA761